MELKLPKEVNAISFMVWFNRTFMELKYYPVKVVVDVHTGFNRTFMELK